jgi:hypothetical protein
VSVSKNFSRYGVYAVTMGTFIGYDKMICLPNSRQT